MNEIVFHPVLPWPLLLAGLLVAAALTGWSLWLGLRSGRRLAVLAACRFLALAGLGVLLLQPQRQRQEVDVIRPQLAVLVDDSASMNDPVDNGQPRRSERVAEFLRSPGLQAARQAFDVRVFDLHQAELPADRPPAKFDAGASDIVGGLGTLVEHFKGQPLAAVLLLTDGLDTSGTARPGEAAFAVPVDTFELEKPFAPKPREQRVAIIGVDAPRRAVVGWHSPVTVSLAGSGMSGRVVPVELWRAGQKIADASAAFNEDEQTRTASFEVTHERAGVDQFEVRVPDAAAEKSGHAYPFAIDVSEPGKRVLYVQNQLSFDYKFLRQAIVSNRNLQLSAYTRWPDGRLVNLDSDRGGGNPPPLDFSPRALASHAVVILGDLAPDALPAESWRNLRDYVDHGGSLVLLGGKSAFAGQAAGRTALADILPVRPPAEYREGNFPVRITDTGLHHPIFGPVFAQVKDFPPLLTANAGGTLAPSAEVLMQTVVEGQPQPLVAAVRFGGGRVVAVLSDSVWRWRLGAAQWRQDLSPYELFWTQLLDWLVPREENGHGSSVELFTERSSYLLGEKPEVRAVVQTATGPPPATLPLRVRTPDGRTLDYTLLPAVFPRAGGQAARGYAAAVEPNVAGVFRAESSANLGGISTQGETRFVVTQPATEITGKPIDRDFLQKLAAASKGRYYALGEWDRWPGDLHVEERHSSRTELTDLWNHPALIGAIMALLAAEWITRKVWHLP